MTNKATPPGDNLPFLLRIQFFGHTQQFMFNAAVVEVVRDLIGRAAIALWDLE